MIKHPVKNMPWPWTWISDLGQGHDIFSVHEQSSVNYKLTMILYTKIPHAIESNGKLIGLHRIWVCDQSTSYPIEVLKFVFIS